jgi:hypothetical protein
MLGLNLINDKWVKAGKLIHTHVAKQSFWHCGVLSRHADISDDIAMWGFANPLKKYWYRGQVLNVGPGWLYEAVNHRDLKLAVFTGTDFHDVALLYKASHDKMKMVLTEWIVRKELDGAFATNGSSDEIVLIHPKSDLTPVSFTQL